MAGLFLIGLTFIANMARTSSDYQNAADTSRRALMADKDNQKQLDEITSKSERWAVKHTGMTKDELAYFAYAAPLVTRSVTTKPLKGLKLTLPNGFVIRPEITYNFNGNPETYRGLLVLTREF